MVYKVYKLFLKLVASFALVLINILFVSIFLYSESAFSINSDIERNLAYKFCDSKEKNLFKGLDNEKILKYEYFFNSINKEAIYEELEKLTKFPSEVETMCSYKLSNEELENLKKMVKSFMSNN